MSDLNCNLNADICSFEGFKPVCPTSRYISWTLRRKKNNQKKLDVLSYSSDLITPRVCVHPLGIRHNSEGLIIRFYPTVVKVNTLILCALMSLIIKASLFRFLGCWSSGSLHPPVTTSQQWGITQTRCYVCWQMSSRPTAPMVTAPSPTWVLSWRWWSERTFWSACFIGTSAGAWTQRARGHCSSCLRCSLGSPSSLCCSTQLSSTLCWGSWELVLNQSLAVLQRLKTVWSCCSTRCVGLIVKNPF